MDEAAYRGGVESSLSIEGRCAMEENNVIKFVGQEHLLMG
jgi:hypothetical protein